ncbi:MAG: alpha-amylase family protein, partial [Candidatus Hydrogenedentales bacterium]
PYELRLQKPSDRNYAVRSLLRQPGRPNPFEIVYKAVLHEGEQTFRLYVPATSGKFYLDVWLLEGDKVVEWHTESIEVEGRPAITQVKLSKPIVQTQDTLGVDVMLLPSPRPCTVHVRAVDALGRLVARATQQVKEGVTIAQTPLNLSDLLTTSVKIEAYAVDRETPDVGDWDLRQAAFECRYVSVRQPLETDRFSLVATEDGSAEYNARRAFKTLHELGVDFAETAGNETATTYLGRSGIQSFARVVDYVADGPAVDLERQPCLNDPRFLESDSEALAAAATALRFQGIGGYSVGTGNALSQSEEDVCHSQYCLEAYWNRLQQAYGGLDQLNTAWGTTYADWDSVKPPARDAVTASGQYAPWVDFRTSMNATFTETHARAQKTIQGVDSRARVGFKAHPQAGVFQGYDWGRLVPMMDWLAVDSEALAVERVRSFKKKDAWTGIVLSKGPRETEEVREQWTPWYAVFHGFQSLWWPDAMATGSGVGDLVMLGPEGTPLPTPPSSLAEVAIIQGGVAKLLAQSERLNSGIAVYDGAASAILSRVEGGGGITSEEELGAFIALLHGLGYQFDLVSDEQIAGGALSAFRVLVLPKARALSDKEAAAILQFHQAGGSLIADFAPGVYNEHGLPRTANPLLAAFGVERSKPGAWGAPAAGSASVKLDGDTFEAELEGVTAESRLAGMDGVEPGGAAGEAPVWFVRRGEQGVAALLNHDVKPLLAKPNGGCALIRALLRAAGAVPILELSDKGNKLFQGELIGYRLGETRIVGVLASPDAAEQKLRARIGDPRVVTDMRKGVRVMRPKSIDMTLKSGSAELYSSLPYDVTGVELGMPKSMALGERFPMVFTVTTRKGTPGVHVIHVELYFLSGDQEIPLRHYAQDVVCPKGTGNAFIPFAFNERPGVYKLIARDVLSCKFADSIIQVLKTGEVITGAANLM